ncbi:MAG: DUF1272 domain-containing protein [Emcibacteraceae bacterium]|nr:DUF1272 domain-containing protein [Emcibacteraceae bacterium]MDG1725698.1 DUF1272 domain-containing protein [Emcibacteraceae bacterium]
MMELRPNCEHCDKDLPFDASDAMICTFECTFCEIASIIIIKENAQIAVETLQNVP